MPVNKTDINPATGKAYAVNPSSGNWDDNYWSQNEAKFNGNSSSGISGAVGSFTDPLNTARNVQSFYKEQNQPAIASLQKQSTDLDTRYKDLISSIKGQQKTAEDAQILATNNEMGRRGISNTSGIYEQQQAQALRPIASNYQSLTANTGLAQQKDSNAIANLIAQLQAGNPSEAISAATNWGQQAQQANQFQQNLGLQKQQLEETSRQNAIANALAANKNSYLTLGEGQTLFDPKTFKDVQSSLGWE